MKHSSVSRKTIAAGIALLLLVAADIVVSRSRDAVFQLPPIDSLLYESGSDEVDGYTSASIITHVTIVRSDHPGLALPAPVTAELTDSQIRAMVLKAIQLDRHYGTTFSELKYTINAKGANAWVSLMPNLNAVPGARFMPGDGTDPRIIRAVLDYIADSTAAGRISILAGGSYGAYAAETDIFDLAEFTTTVSGATINARWCTYYPDLDSNFTLRSIVDAAKSRNPGKTIECINSNYNEILQGGTPYNELDEAGRAGKQPEYYPVPVSGAFGLGSLPTSNAISDSGRYNPTDAVKNCDILVNLPVMKTTGDVQVNCVFKNYMGSVSRAVYSGGAYPSNRATALNAIDHTLLVNSVLNLFAFHPCEYAIIDALSSLEGEGSHPWTNRTGWLRRNFIMAGADPLALEAVAALSMNLNPLDIDMLRLAEAKGFGIPHLRRMSIIGTPLDSVRTDVLGPAGGDGVYRFPGFASLHYMGRGCRRWLVNGPHAAADNTIDHIDEAGADPRPGSQGWTPLYSTHDSVDLAALLPTAVSGSAVYAFTQIFSEHPQSGKLYCGGVRDLKVYVNGVKVVDTTGILSYSNVNVIRDVALNRGDNRILVKVRRSGTQFKFSLGVVNSGLESPRNSYRPHLSGGRMVGAPVAMSQDLKRAFFGGRTLPGTFYHLGQSDPIAIEALVSKTPETALLPNSPNPFNASTRIRFTLTARDTRVELSVFDVSGRLLKKLYNGVAAKGLHEVRWDGRDQDNRRPAAGVYVVRLQTNTGTITRQIMMVR